MISSEPERVKAAIQGLSQTEARALVADWELWARDNQLEPPGQWAIWFLITGRGWGKNRTAGEAISRWAREGRYRIFHLVAATAADCRDVMVEGESGLLHIGPVEWRPHYEPSKRRVTWPNGAYALLFSAEEPERLRGPQCEAWWADEVAAWKYIQETWDMLQFGARLGSDVRGIVTTTPKPVQLIRDLISRKDVHLTRGHTNENRANLAASFFEHVVSRYEGSRLGRQELAGEILDDNPNALWKRDWIEAHRLTALPPGVRLKRTVTALDPSGSTTGNEAGIITAGRGTDNRFYVLSDDSMRGSPRAWGKQSVAAYHTHGSGRLIYETNYGGEMVETTIETVDNHVALRGVRAMKGKEVRAEPVAALAEQGKISHVGEFPQLEDELCQWEPGDSESPNRLDAFVYAILDLWTHGAGGLEIIDRRILGI